MNPFPKSLLRPAALALTLAALGLVSPSEAAQLEENAWPVVVRRFDETGQIRSWQAVGPLVYRQPMDDGTIVSGLRPLFLRRQQPDGAEKEVRVLYPLFTYRAGPESLRWSLLQLVNRSSARGTPDRDSEERFDLWPFWFSRQTGDPETSYRALFPVAGTLKNRLFSDRTSWFLFPLYVRTQRGGAVMTGTPWPFVRIFSGEGHTGFSLWPLLDWRSRAGDYRRNYYLWPLVYDVRTNLGARVPNRSWGVLPFYAAESTPEVTAESWLFPFFGYTHRIQPHRYDETRWFWPLFVQGQGDERLRNRWAPFYTHSVFLGEEKTWILWPLWRQRTWPDPGIVQTKIQFLYFLYWSRVQRSATNPDMPAARKTHLWPLVSTWDNGAGSRQVQLFSPLEVFFPDNDNVRLNWSPLAAIYRYEVAPDSGTRHAALFDLVTWRRTEEEREFHLGPLLGVTAADDAARVAVAGGLFGMRRAAGAGWRSFWFDFSGQLAESGAQTQASSVP